MTNKKAELQNELLELLEAKALALRYSKMDSIFPDEGQFRRELYPKHVQFMDAGSKFLQRAIIAANRTGKTLMGAYEMTCHLTGRYPDWWKGRKFKNPINAWAASVNNESTKNILQYELVGDPNDMGTGMIPKECLGKYIKKPGVADALETQYVKHITGGWSRIDFKSYEQGRAAFQGTKKQAIWLDEEPTDYGIYSECLTRTMDKHNPGIIYCTFTPLYGLSEVVLSFMPDGKLPEGGVNPQNPYKFVSQVSWEEVPHLNEEQKAQILASYSSYEREARSQGIPSLGAGAIYPFPESMVGVDPVEIQMWWPRVYGLDVGWNRTAGIWLAKDPDTGIVYVYSEHYMGREVPAIHASAIKARGDWIPGVIDPASNAASKVDGSKLFDLYEQEGLILEHADNSVEAGLFKVTQMLQSGQLKIFSNLKEFWGEYRVYRRDEKGRVIKKNDHLMDALRYAVMSGLEIATTIPDPDAKYNSTGIDTQRDSITGY